MADKQDFASDLETALQKCLQDLNAGQGSEARMVERIIACLQAIETNIDEEETAARLAMIRKILSSMIYSNSLSPKQVLDMILRAQKQETLQMLLRFLPSLMEDQEIESASEPVVSILLDSCQRIPDSRLPILECLSVLPLTGEARKLSFQQAFKSLALVKESEWPSLLRILLRIVSDRGEAMMLWSTIRVQGNDFEVNDYLMMAVQHILDRFRQDQKRDLLRTTYLYSVSESEDVAHPLDVILLLGLSNEHEDPVDKIFDTWLSRECFPYALCEAVMKRICSSSREKLSSSFYQRVVDGLLRLAIFLFLTPARVPTCEMQSIVTLVFQMINLLDDANRNSLLSSLVHLSEEVDGLAIEESASTERENAICRPVNDLLLQIAQCSPDLLISFKETFIRRLCCDTGTHRSTLRISAEYICYVLVAIVEASQNGYGELMELLQRLLFLSTGGYSFSSNDSIRVVCGLTLSRVIVGTSTVSEMELKQIEEWVQKIMLPSTRRTIAPEVGSASLMVLQALANRETSESASKAYFEHFKMILANTGLIQKLSQYKVGRNSLKHNIIAYQNVPPELASYTAGHEDDQFSPQDIIFCVDYFTKISTVTDPTRWKCTCLWVFELTDMYLTLARKNAMKDWAAEGWLQASIEFSNFSFPSVSSALDTALGDANDYSLHSQIMSFKGDQLNEKLAEEFVLMLCQYEIALLVGISLSLAVLKNASEHFTLTFAPEKQISRQRLMLYQMMKIFHLKSKSSKILKLFRALKVSSKRKRQSSENISEVKRKQTTSSPSNGTRSFPEVGALQLSSPVENAAIEVDKIHALLFSDPYLSPRTLWKVLQRNDSNHSILRILKEKVLARKQFTPFDLAMFYFHCKFLKELALSTSFLYDEVDLTVQSLFQSMKTIVEFYIHIRKANASLAVDAQVLDVVVHLARAYCKLLAVVLTESQALESNERVDGGRNKNELLELVALQLKEIEDVGVAHFQLDIISCLVKRSDVGRRDRIIEISWSSLHDVYCGSIELVSGDWQKHLSRIVQTGKTKASPEVKKPLESLLKAAAASCWDISVKAFAPYSLSIIRHFALISDTPHQLSRYSHHVVKLVEEADSLARALHATIRGEKVEFDGKQRTTRAIPASCFPFLNSTTLPDFLSTLVSLTTLLQKYRQ